MSGVPRSFHVERYFAKYEFTTEYLLCCSDAEALSMKDVVAMADPECRNLWENLKLSYTTSEGDPLLRVEIAKMYGTEPESVLTIVPQEGIYIAHHCIIEYIRRELGVANPHVIATFPAYQSLYENIKTAGCELDYWTVRETAQGWKFELDDLRGLMKDNTKFIVVNFPHNPTGTFPSEDEWRQLIDLCASRGIILFSDEMYRLTNHDDSEPLKSGCSIYKDAVTLSGMSKTFALPGLRLGWLCTTNEKLLAMMQSFKDYTTICGSAPSEILSLIALRNRDTVVAQTVQLLQKNLQILNAFMIDFREEFDWYPPRACTTGLARVKGWLLKLGQGGATGFSKVLVEACGVLLLPASAYEFTDEFVRISFARENMPQALEVLRQFLTKNKPQTPQ